MTICGASAHDRQRLSYRGPKHHASPGGPVSRLLFPVLLCTALALTGCRAKAGAVDAPNTPGEAAPVSKGSHVVLDEGQLAQVRIETLSANAPDDAVKA